MQRPTSLGLFLCERYSIEQGSGRRSLMFMIEEMTAAAFPFTSPPFTVYAELTDGQGRMLVDLIVTDIDGEIELISAPLPIEFQSPLTIAHVRFRFTSLTFPEPGQYLFELAVNGERICHRRLLVQPQEEES